ncbi:MAG: RNA 2',3'-cyclic phosphodiesterase [Armatimonadota bacterium]|nr:RNA 2',3'-cyclic phosphodiesterase [Armatimonadota bacterium]MCX7778510.1 RNA 2',3'-cyclic phosphodiesterase [Armatimonadota bacterium]MDW8024944.1 RNA 2',3'-cyclic phosphodiesterase [Armatimonadota bacterium]
MSHVRSFIAIEFPEDVRERIGNVIAEAAKHGGAIKWVEIHNLHLTLKFLGNVHKEDIPKVSLRLDAVAKKFIPLEFEVAGVGGFPSLRRPRVLWVGVVATEELLNLQRCIENEMFKLGIPREERPFHPHITIGRVKSTRGLSSTLEALEKFEREQFGRVLVSHITLMRSDLLPSGPVYTPISRHELLKMD